MAIYFHSGTRERQVWNLDRLDRSAAWEVSYHLPDNIVLSLGVFSGRDDNLAAAMAFAEAYCKRPALRGDVWIKVTSRVA